SQRSSPVFGRRVDISAALNQQLRLLDPRHGCQQRRPARTRCRVDVRAFRDQKSDGFDASVLNGMHEWRSPSRIPGIHTGALVKRLTNPADLAASNCGKDILSLNRAAEDG